MRYSTKEANKKIAKIEEEWNKKRLAKLRCTKCTFRDQPITQ